VANRSNIRERYSFGNLDEPLELPDLLAVQRESFQWFLDEGLANTFRDISPIKDFSEKLQLELEFDPFDEDLRPPPKFTVEECKQKEALFNSLNKDYLVQQERKESDRASAEAASKDREVDEAAQVEGRARYLSKNRGRKKKSEMDEPTTEEALLAAVSTRKISRKINYDAMSAIFDDSGGFSTDVVDDGAADQSGMEAEFI